MLNPSYVKFTPEKEGLFEGLHFYKRLYLPLQEKGLDCFDADGNMENVWGGQVIAVVLAYCQEKEWYERCTFLLKLQVGFIAKYGVHKNKKTAG